jgi:hypothetical protein
MISAYYEGINASLDSLQKILPEHAKKAGWNVKDIVSSSDNVKFELKKGFLDKATITVKLFAQDASLEVQAPKESMKRDLMDVAETAITNSCANPAAVVVWRKQEQIRAQAAVKSWAPDWNPNAPVQSQEQAAPVQVAKPETPKPPAPKLEACMHCTAPLTCDPEEVLVICNYCGYVNNTTGEQPPRYSMLPVVVDGSKAMEIAKDHVAKGVLVTRGMAERAEWGSIILRYVPNWAVTIQLNGYVEGKRAIMKTKSAKGQVAQEVAFRAMGGALGGLFGGAGKGAGEALVDRTERMSISETMDVSIVARKAAEFQPDAGAYKIPLDKKEPFRKTGDETLNVEISDKAAAERAKSLALQQLRTRYTVVKQFSVGANPFDDSELIYSPWWFIEYRMGGKSFSVIVDACNGSVIAGQRPWLPKRATKGR